MDWRAKAFAHALFSAMPGGHRINYFAQRVLTQNLPISDERFLEILSASKKRVEQLQPYLAKPLGKMILYEIGAGWDLLIPLIHWSLGVEQQILVDIRPLSSAELVNDAIERLGRTRAFDLPRRPVEKIREGRIAEDLERRYGIRYLAPCDAKETHLSSASVDVITSTNTLEHVPGDDILPILRESSRLLAPGGIICLHVDYQDHYSFSDPSISPFNFLRFSERRWALVNPPLHHQNRLRHREYLMLYEAAGFELLVEDNTGGSSEDIERVRSLPLDRRFRSLEPAELAVRTSTVVLRRKAQPRVREAAGGIPPYQALPVD